MKNHISTLRYVGLQLFWRTKGFIGQFPARRYPKHLFYIVAHERSGTHFLINTIMLNAEIRRGYGMGAGAGWGRHNIGEWFGPYEQLAQRFDHIDSVNAAWERLSSRAAIIKTHCDRALFDEKYIQAPVVYIHRDPRDTLLSWYHYLNQDRLYRIHPYLEDHRGTSFSEFLRRPATDFLKWNYFLEPAFENVAERWAAHIAGWLTAKDPAVLSLRFSDVKYDPQSVLERIAAHTGIGLKEEFRAAGLMGTESMLPRKGVSGEWKSAVTQEDEAFIRAAAEKYGLEWSQVADR